MKAQYSISQIPGLVVNQRSFNNQVNVPARAPATRDVFIGSSDGRDVQAKFREQFGRLATDPKKFQETMKLIFGTSHDTRAAEELRQRALKGDFGWLPPVRWVNSQTLQGANGAYDAESGTVLLNSALKGDPSLAASTYVEEAGHHLDTKLNTADSPGDEGELFRRVLNGEKLTSTQINEIRAENDKGTVYIDGKAKQVEFWKNPFKALGKAIGRGFKAVGKAVLSVGKGLWHGVKTVFSGITRGLGGFLSNLVRGRVGGALTSLIHGAGKIFRAPLRILGGAFSAGQNLLRGATTLFQPLLKPFLGRFLG